MTTSLQVVQKYIDPLLDDLMLDEEEREDLRDHIIEQFDERYNDGIEAAAAYLDKSGGLVNGASLRRLKIAP